MSIALPCRVHCLCLIASIGHSIVVVAIDHSGGMVLLWLCMASAIVIHSAPAFCMPVCIAGGLVWNGR